MGTGETLTSYDSIFLYQHTLNFVTHDPKKTKEISTDIAARLAIFRFV